MEIICCKKYANELRLDFVGWLICKKNRASNSENGRKQKRKEKQITQKGTRRARENERDREKTTKID